MSELKHLAKSIRGKGAPYILAGSFLMKVAAFLGSIILVRLMAKAEYGALSYMENLYTYAHLFAGFGLNNAVFRYVVLKDADDAKLGVICYVIKAGTVFNIALVILVGAGAKLFPHQAEFSMASYMLPLMLTALPLQFLFETGTYSLRALFKNRGYAAFAVMAITIVWLFKVIGAVSLGLPGAVLSWPAAYLIMSTAILLYCFRGLFRNVQPSPIGKEERGQINRYSVQYMVTNGLWAMFLQNDLLLLGMLTGNAAAVASYKVAYAIPAAMSIFSSSIGMFVAPYFVKNETNRVWIWRNYKKVLASSVLILGVLTGACAILAEPIILFVYGDQYSDSVLVMQVLLVAAFLSNAIRYTAANLLSAMGNVRPNMAVSALGIIMQIVLDFLLIPQHGAIGAATASVLVYGIMSAAIIVVFVRRYRIGA